MKHKRKVGRPRKFRLGEIVFEDGATKVVVDHRLRGTKSEYKVVPTTGRRQRFGKAAWKTSEILTSSGERSSTGSIATYRANQWLDQELPEGRGCECHCCTHESIPIAHFSVHTGIMKDLDD